MSSSTEAVDFHAAFELTFFQAALKMDSRELVCKTVGFSLTGQLTFVFGCSTTFEELIFFFGVGFSTLAIGRVQKSLVTVYATSTPIGAS